LITAASLRKTTSIDSWNCIMREQRKPQVEMALFASLCDASDAHGISTRDTTVESWLREIRLLEDEDPIPRTHGLRNLLR
jgi:hypothetical protein